MSDMTVCIGLETNCTSFFQVLNLILLFLNVFQIYYISRIVDQNQPKLKPNQTNSINKKIQSLSFGQLQTPINLFSQPMQIINQLLKSTPEDVREGYKSHLRLHLKYIMTTINKSRLQDLTETQIRKNKCILACYQKTENSLKCTPELQKSNSTHQSTDDLILAVDQLKECKKGCKKEQQAVKQHLDDVNFYSKRKFAGCSSKCEKKYQEILEEEKTKSGPSAEVNKDMCKPYNQCMWDCYNRLDRRYKDYWKGQQNDIIKEYL